nr:platelet endothelial aggregation receptor 1-like [Biomphalaria glabrata]
MNVTKKCNPQAWGDDCSKSCIHCADECNQVTGSCTKCLSGYKDPVLHCSKECDKFEFGADCIGDCKTKCGMDIDCINRVTGQCPEEQGFAWYLIITLLSVILFAGIVYYVVTKKQSTKNLVLNGSKTLTASKSKLNEKGTMGNQSDDV